MDIVLIVVLGVLGALLGSFAGAQVWRLRAHQLIEDEREGEEVDAAELLDGPEVDAYPLRVGEGGGPAGAGVAVDRGARGEGAVLGRGGGSGPALGQQLVGGVGG